MKDENNDINLPPDADDLSKHAPLLFALKNKEEGFVVPALYFEELSELVVSKTWIPEDGGLIVPENYFEESMELIVSKSSLPTDDGLVLLENYFEELSSLIETKTGLPSESGLAVPENYFEALSENIEAQISLENLLPKTETEVPEGYFSELENKLHVHIALDNVKQDEGFVVPDHYFANLTERVLAETSLSKEEVNGDEVPAGYFDSLHDKVVARLESESSEEKGRVIVLSQWKKYAAITAVAASVALLVVFAWMSISNDDNGNGTLNFAYNNSKGIVPENIVKEYPLPMVDTNSSNVVVAPERIAYELPKNHNEIKPESNTEVIMNDDMIAQMDEALVMEFVSESGVIEETEEVLDPAMMEYLMNDNSSLDVFGPGE